MAVTRIPDYMFDELHIRGPLDVLRHPVIRREMDEVAKQTMIQTEEEMMKRVLKGTERMDDYGGPVTIQGPSGRNYAVMPPLRMFDPSAMAPPAPAKQAPKPPKTVTTNEQYNQLLLLTEEDQ